MNKDRGPIRIVIADEQAGFRCSLRKLLGGERGIHIVGEAPDPDGAVKLARQLKPDILLLALPLARALDLQGPTSLSSGSSSARMVIMLESIEKSRIVEAFQLGAHGIVLKASPLQALVQSLLRVHSGHYWVEHESVEVLVEAVRDLLSLSRARTSSSLYGLTPRELDIIAKIASGHSNKQVGEEFSISERTVKHHLTNIFTKVGVSSRLQLALFAVSHHLMQDHVGPLDVSGARSDPEA